MLSMHRVCTLKLSHYSVLQLVSLWWSRLPLSSLQIIQVSHKPPAIWLATDQKSVSDLLVCCLSVIMCLAYPAQGCHGGLSHCRTPAALTCLLSVS